MRTGTVARRYLSVDQSMIVGVFGNVLAGDLLRCAFVTPRFQRAVRPLLAAERFTVPAGEAHWRRRRWAPTSHVIVPGARAGFCRTTVSRRSPSTWGTGWDGDE